MDLELYHYGKKYLEDRIMYVGGQIKREGRRNRQLEPI